MTRILVWVCSDGDLPFAFEETSHLESMRSAKCDVVVAPSSLTWDELGSFASITRPTVFHYIGHGYPTGELNVRDGDGHVGRPAADVIKVVRRASAALEGVYLSGCFTARTAPEVLENLPPAAGWAIGTGFEVDDELAARFTERFYTHLITSKMSPQQAFDVAYAYAKADWGAEVSHSAWFQRSRLPAVDEMARTISSAIRAIFSRPAFMVPMRQELSMNDLDLALQDVSHALGTGQALSRRDRTPIASISVPVAWLQDPEIDEFVQKANRAIASTRRALNVVRDAAGGTDYVVGNGFHLGSLASQEKWMKQVNAVDTARNRVLDAANELFTRNDLQPLPKIELSFT